MDSYSKGENMFHVILLCWCSWSLIAVFGLESVSVTEGESVTLYMNITEQQRKDGIWWKFGLKDSKSLIAEIKDGNNEIKLYDSRPDGRFKDSLKLDQTGSLTITNTRITQSGLYHITTSKQEDLLNKIFNITFYTRLPVPVIIRDSSQNSSLSDISNCCVLCSVLNVSHDVSLSWYKGNSLLSSISVSERSNISSISLHLECLDDSYTCVVNNPITNQTQHLNTDDCHKCSDVSEDVFCSCGFTEAVIRLVISSLVGVATVAVLVYDVKSRGDEQKKKRSDTQIK